MRAMGVFGPLRGTKRGGHSGRYDNNQHFPQCKAPGARRFTVAARFYQRCRRLGMGALVTVRSTISQEPFVPSVVPDVDAMVSGADYQLKVLTTSLQRIQDDVDVTPLEKAGLLSDASGAAGYLRTTIQLLIDASEDKIEGATALAQDFQSALTDKGAMVAFVQLASVHHVSDAWLAVQTLCYNNKKTCALMVRDGHYAHLHSILMIQPHDICNEKGEVVMAANPPSHEIITAAFVLSTLVAYNRQHNKLVTRPILERLQEWILGLGSSGKSEIVVLGRTLTLKCRAISIARDVSVNAAMHEQLIDVGIGEALSLSIAEEVDPRRKVASIVSVCMLVNPDETETSGIMSIEQSDYDLVMEAITCCQNKIACYGMSWRMWTLMLALHKLSIKDENRIMMLEHSSGIVDVLSQVLSETYDMPSIVRRYALLTVWNLCFEGEGMQRVQESETLLPLIHELTDTTTSLKVIEAAKGVLFTVGQLQTRQMDYSSDPEDSDGPPLSRRTSGQKHVMISYEWSHQQRVLVLAKCLEDYGYKVWLDLENMSGSTLEAMATAVEESSVVICCVSRRYKNSQACRTEAEYAFQQRVRIIPVIFEKEFKPTGWLGALLGTRLYFSMYETYQVQAASRRLALELGDVSRCQAGEALKFQDIDLTKSYRHPLGKSMTVPRTAEPAIERHSEPSKDYVFDIAIDDTDTMLAVTQWTPQDVSDWLIESNLPEVAKCWYALEIDGLALQGLLELAVDGSLRTCLKEDLKVTNPVDLLRIVANLGMLFNMGHT